MALHKKCEGCSNNHLTECNIYNAYPEQPLHQWTRIGGCAARPKTIEEAKERFVDPLKASKRQAKGKATASLKDMGVKRTRK